MKNLLLTGIALICIFLLTNCATIIHGTTQTVGISSSPSSASIIINGQNKGKTPINIDLSRKDNHLVKIELDGYLPFETTLTRKVDGWVAGNIIFGGIPGLAIDAITGGMYKLTPEQILAELRQGTALQEYEDHLYLAITLKPNTKWEKIGSLNNDNNN